jgi:hypothetical protein
LIINKFVACQTLAAVANILVKLLGRTHPGMYLPTAGTNGSG